MRLTLIAARQTLRLSTGATDYAMTLENVRAAEAARIAAEAARDAAMLAVLLAGGSTWIWKGEYLSSRIYDPDDLVSYQGDLWLSTTNQMEVAPAVGQVGWTKLAAGDGVNPGGGVSNGNLFAHESWTFASE